MELPLLKDTATMASNIGLFPKTELIQDRRKLLLVFCSFILFIIAFRCLFVI